MSGVKGGALEAKTEGQRLLAMHTVRDAIQAKKSLIMVHASMSVGEALAVMRDNSVTALPVWDVAGRW